MQERNYVGEMEWRKGMVAVQRFVLVMVAASTGTMKLKSVRVQVVGGLAFQIEKEPRFFIRFIIEQVIIIAPRPGTRSPPKKYSTRPHPKKI